MRAVGGVLHTRWFVSVLAAILLLVAAAASSAQPGATPAEHHDDQPDSASSPSSNPVLQIRGFGDLQFHAVDTKGAKTTFSLGQLDLFITSTLGDSFSVLTEAVVEANDANEFGFELERLQLQYFPNDHFKLIVGRYHANIGYYNTAYHHGTWFQTTVGRPALFAFEDEGGILPIHDVGISATGLISSGAVGLHYIAEIGNGRNWNTGAEPVQSARDDNSGKAVNVGLYSRPQGWPGFQAGASFYRDRLQTSVEPDVTESIFSAHVVYESPQFELLNEFVLLQFRPSGARAQRSPAFYSQVSRRFGRTRPYARYEFIDVDAGTPFIGDIDRQHGPSLGVRYEAGSFVALKAQYDHVFRRASDSSNVVTVQAAFAF